MKTVGYRMEDVAKELKTSIAYAYVVARRKDFPRPWGVVGTAMFFNPDAVKRYVRERRKHKRTGSRK